MALANTSKEEILQDILDWTGKTPKTMTVEEIVEYTQHGLNIVYAERELEVKEWLLSVKQS
jgi:hypothetical protein